MCCIFHLQATRLTGLSLTGPHPIDIPAFFDSLACLTGLRSLSIGAGDVDEPRTILNSDVSVFTAGRQEHVPCLARFESRSGVCVPQLLCCQVLCWHHRT